MKCCKKEDYSIVAEFLDDCKDGMFEEVERIYEEYENKKQLLESKDDDLKTCYHFVSIQMAIDEPPLLYT